MVLNCCKNNINNTKKVLKQVTFSLFFFEFGVKYTVTAPVFLIGFPHINMIFTALSNTDYTLVCTPRQETQSVEYHFSWSVFAQEFMLH